MATFNSALDWSKRDSALETQLEIFQRRGSYESANAMRVARKPAPDALFALDHLIAGERFGFLASSDHKYSDSAFAVVTAEARDRTAVLEALHARRSYAATARIALEISLGDLRMGEEGTIAGDAPQQISVDAGTEIAHIDVVRNGQLAYSWNGLTFGNPTCDGLLTLRYGRSDDFDMLPLAARGLEFGHGQYFDGEDGTANFLESGADWSSQTHLLYGSRRAQAPGGWTIPVRRVGGTDDPMSITLGEGEEATTWGEKGLRFGQAWKRKHLDRPVAIRLLPPPTGVSAMQESWTPGDWKEGDWIYVRVVRTDAGMAWSSPIWIDGIKE